MLSVNNGYRYQYRKNTGKNKKTTVLKNKYFLKYIQFFKMRIDIYNKK